MAEENPISTDRQLTLHNNAWLQAFIHNLPYPAMIVDNNRLIAAANQKLCSFFNLNTSAADIAGLNTFAILMQIASQFKDPKAIEKRVLEIISLQQTVLGDRIETTDGRIIFRDYSPFIVKEKQAGHLWIFYDETDLVKVSELINEQKQFYEDILNKIPSDIAVFSPALRYLFVNPEAIKNSEIRKWIIGKTDFEFCLERGIDIAIAEKRNATFKKVLQEKKEIEWEEKIEKNNTTTYHIRKVSPVLDEKNEVKLIIGYGYNITQRKEYEKQIELQERKYRELFDYSQAIVCTHTPTGIILDINPAFTEQTGFTAAEAVGKSIELFLPEADKPLFKENYLTPLQNSHKLKGVFRVIDKNGNLVYLMYQNIKVENPGQEAYIISFSQDITDRIKIEKELKEAKKITEDTARIKEKFLANMSHEIRTPMNGIMGITALLQKTPLNNEQAYYLKIVQDSTQTLLNIINDILDLEKINTGKVDIEVIPFDVADKLQSTISLFKSIADGKGLYLTLITNFSSPLFVNGDPTRFGQVLNNLIGNAIKFTHEGGVTVKAEINRQSEETVVLHIVVSDTGIGITDDAMQKIFTPFTQAYPETTRIYGGTGLGLSISKNLVEMQNGRIWVTSKPNKGSDFHFEIPFKTNMQQSAMSQSTQNRQGRSINRKIKILLAEDNDINQLLANKIIQHFGFESYTADNGNDAIQLLLQDDFDVILMDIQMPEKNGIETAAEIRALPDEKKKSIPIIALTANALKGEEKKYFAVGMNGYLTKPFKEKELYEAIVEVLPEEYLTPVEQPAEADNSATDTAAESPNSTAKLYNLDDLRMIQKDDDSFVLNIIGLFVQNVPKNALELIEASGKGDWDKVYFIAHKMKSSIDLVNLTKVKEEIRRVELNAKTKSNLEEIPAIAVLINDAVQNAAAQMKAEFSL